MFRTATLLRPLLAAALLGWSLDAGAQATPPIKLWDRAYGGSAGESLHSLCPTVDGGYLLGCTSNSGVGSTKAEPSRGDTDYWLVKIAADGSKQWDRTYGGANQEVLWAVHQTTDGGYIVGGYSESPISGDRTAPPHLGIIGRPVYDFWVVKLDAQGNKLWDRSYGGGNADMLSSLQQTADGGYILGGKSYSGVAGERSQPSRGLGDYWVIKIDAQGNKQWDKALGGSQDEALSVVQQTADGGYALAGISGSSVSGDRTQPSRGSNDYWLVKLDAQGNKQWDKAYGGNNSDLLHGMQLTADGGFILAGQSDSDVSGEKTQPHYGNNSGYNYDYWVVKTDAAGTLQWQRTYGGNNVENLQQVHQTADGGYLLAGMSSSEATGDKSQPSRTPNNNGYIFDYWLLKLSANGTKEWDQTYGGSDDDQLFTAALTADGNYLLGGESRSPQSADRTQPSFGSWDAWVVRVGQAGPAAVPPVTISGDSLLCAGTTVTLTATASPTPTAYLWNTGATTASIQVTQPGQYSVQATFAAGVHSTAQYQVRLRPAPALPAFSLGPDTTICAGETLVLRAPVVAGLSYRWSDGSTGPTLSVQQAGTYSVQVSTSCASQQASRQVQVRLCVVIPNIITPNADRRNDQFRLQGLPTGSCRLTLYNRWGRQVYDAPVYQNDWGDDAAPGLYYYKLTHNPSGATYKGWLEVSR